MPGLIASVAMRPPPLIEVEPSSQVMKMTESVNAALSVICGTNTLRKASPAATELLCMSLIWFGTMNSKSAAAGSNPARCVMRAQRAGSWTMLA